MNDKQREKPDDENGLVLIRTCFNPFEAETMRGALEAAGIACFLSHTHTHTQMSHLAYAMGGIGLWVRRGDAESCRTLLRDAGRQDGGTETAHYGPHENRAQRHGMGWLRMVGSLALTCFSGVPAPLTNPWASARNKSDRAADTENEPPADGNGGN